MFTKLNQARRDSVRSVLATYGSTGLPAFDPARSPWIAEAANKLIHEWQTKCLEKEMRHRGLIPKKGGLSILLHPQGEPAKKRMNELLEYQVDRVSLSFARRRGRKRKVNRVVLKQMVQLVERFVAAVLSNMEKLASAVPSQERAMRRSVHARGAAHQLVGSLVERDPTLGERTTELRQAIKDILLAPRLTPRGRAVAVVAAITRLPLSTVKQYSL
jgi:hypothetical protein